MSNNREPEIILQEIHSKLSQFSDIVQNYFDIIRSELQSVESDPEPYDSHMHMLNRQINNLEALEALLDSKVLPLVKSLGD